MCNETLLTPEEMALVLELLQAERRELPSEIRHTDTARYRHQLEERRHMIDGLITRLGGRIPEAAACCECAC